MAAVTATLPDTPLALEQMKIRCQAAVGACSCLNFLHEASESGAQEILGLPYEGLPSLTTSYPAVRIFAGDESLAGSYGL